MVDGIQKHYGKQNTIFLSFLIDFCYLYKMLGFKKKKPFSYCYRNYL